MHKKLLSMIMVIGLIFSGIIIVVPENTNAEYSGLSYYWDDEGGSDNLASTATNWYEMNGEIKTDNVAPTLNSDVYINESSSAITWDITTEINSITIASSYSGIFTLGSNITTGNVNITSGTLTGSASYIWHCKGYFNITSTMTSNLLILYMEAEDKSITTLTGNLHSLRISANTTLVSNGNIRNALTIDSGKTLIISSGKQLTVQTYNAGYGYTNNGYINRTGNGVIKFQLYSQDRTMIFGNVNAHLTLELLSTAPGSRTLTLGANTILGGNFTIASSHPSNILTFDQDGYTLSCHNLLANVRTIYNGGETSTTCLFTFDVHSATYNKETSKVILLSKVNSNIYTGTNELYQLEMGNGTIYQLMSNLVVTDKFYYWGSLSLNGFSLTAPIYSLTSTLTELSYDEYQTISYIITADSIIEDINISSNASFLSLSGNTISGIPNGGDSGTYFLYITTSNVIGNVYQYYNITVNNSVYCYFNSTPDTSLTAGEIYNYHPEIVCNGTYAFYMNNNGALVVSNITGNVTGYPIAGIYDISLYVIDSDGNMAYQNWTLTVIPFTDEWTNSRIVDIALLVIIMGIITLFNYLGYVKSLFLLQILSFIVFIFVLVPLWPGSEIGGLLVLVFGIGNIGLLIGGLMK